MTAIPSVSFTNGASSQLFIGQTADLTLRFDNTAIGNNVGYAPYINVVLPTNGADGAGAGNSPVNDGVSFVSATYLGAPVEAHLVEFDATGHATHPFALDSVGHPVILTGTSGDTLLVLRLPFGSFTTDQTPADIALRLAVSNLADVNSLLGVTATGGFAYGADPFNNPITDAPLAGASATLSINPVVALLTKIYNGPEQETATGPSYAREWTVKGDLAPGQHFTTVTLTDTMPDGTVVTGAHLEINGVPVVGGSVATTLNADGTTSLVGSFPGTITGGTQTPTMVIDFYVTEFLHDGTPVLDPATGGFRQLDDNARLDADWQPIDGRDGLTHITIDPAGPENTITAKSIAVQKGVVELTAIQPHGTLEYTVEGQVSNYFEMKDLVLKDTLGDGQTFDAGFTPTIIIREGGVVTYSGSLSEYTLSSKDAAGKTLVQFDVSQALQDNGLDRVLDGNGGGLGGASHANAYNQATIEVKFHSVVDPTWTGFVPGDPFVDQGDTVGNDVLFGGGVYNTGTYKEDDSHASIVLPVNTVSKSLYAVNGDTGLGTTTFTNPVKVQAGDLITYRLGLDFPLTASHSVKLTDFLPLPVLQAADSNADGTADSFTWDGLLGAGTPAAGHIGFGPTDQLHLAVPGATPILTVDPVANSLTIDFGEVVDTILYPAQHLDLLFTTTVGDAPFGDGLFLTNQVTSSELNSLNAPSLSNSIIQFDLGEPALKITKGIIGTDHPGAVLDSPAGPVAFTAPGSAGVRFAGTIDRAALAATPVNANLSGVDAGDTVSFAIVLENKGQGYKGAFDTLVHDTLPTGYALPAGGANITVTYGDGTAVPYHALGSGLFDPAGGIQLDDGSSGAIGEYDPHSAHNVVVITYDLKLIDALATPNPALLNTASIVHYAAAEGGIDRVPTDSQPTSDTAAVSVLPSITKVVSSTTLAQTGTNQGNLANADLAIGEQVTYTITVRLPEGIATAVQLDDLLPTAGAQIKALSATVLTA